jgi:hypothetical protein
MAAHQKLIRSSLAWIDFQAMGCARPATTIAADTSPLFVATVSARAFETQKSMKSTGSSKKFPTSPAEIEALIANAPGKDRPLTSREEAKWSTGVLVNGGGHEAVRKALAAKRKPGQRGPQLAPMKQLVSATRKA